MSNESGLVLPHHDLVFPRLTLRDLDHAEWRCAWCVDKYAMPVTIDDIMAGRADPFEVVEHAGNLLMTAGAADLFNGLSTAGLATPWNTTNTYLAVGDSNTAASVAQTDMQAAAGTTLNTGDITGATNATPIVLAVAGGWGTTPVVGQVVRVAGVLGNTNANGDFEVSAVDSTHITLLNSAGNSGFATSAGSTVKLLKRYKQRANATGSAVVSSNQIVYVAAFPAANANHAWAEWGTQLVTATNLQAGSTNSTPGPAKMLNRAVYDNGTKTSSAVWTLTATLSLA